MNSRPHWDVIVVGAGLGGSIAAWQLARRGLDVLVIESGHDNTAPIAARSVYSRLLDRLWTPESSEGADWSAGLLTYYRRSPDEGRTLRRIVTRLGQGLGGTSVRYAAALGRFRRSDFAGSVAEGAMPLLPNAWPISYDEFLGYYLRAEALLRACGESDPLDPDDNSNLAPPPQLSDAAEALRASLVAKGHAPFRLHVAVDYLPGCIECFGARCARDCKADGYNRALRPALETGRVSVETGLKVDELRPDEGGVTVTVRDRDGRAEMRRARRIVLAAGALNTPLILEQSSSLWNDSGPPAMLGRGLMFHVSDFFMVMTRREPGGRGPRKWLALRDFYNDGDIDLGEIQSTGYSWDTGAAMQALRELLAALPLQPAAWMVEALRPIAWSVAKLVGQRPIFTTITEDLPDARNRVSGEDGRIVVEYAVDPALQRRAAGIRTKIRTVFAPFGVHFMGRKVRPNWGHPMGTCRMGLDPETSVTDPDGKVHDQPRIYVADASVFPASGGTGPALTVVANALRVADALASAECDSERRAANHMAPVSMSPAT